jgi:hypothetical protein
MNPDREAFRDKALLPLRRAVRDALVRKRQLGQYAVVARDGVPVILPPEALPGPLDPGAEPTQARD